MEIDSGSWVRASGINPWTFKWNTSTVDDGTHIISARSYDGISYSEDASVKIRVNNHILMINIIFIKININVLMSFVNIQK